MQRTRYKYKNKSFSRKKKIWLAVVAGLVVVVLGWWAWDQFAPRPLGDKLEYLGKEDYGGWFMKRYSVYYYGTDLTPEEVVAYFPEVELRYPVEQKSGYTEIILKAPSSQDMAIIYYYETVNKAQMSFSVDTHKSHVIKTRDDNYQMLKVSL